MGTGLAGGDLLRDKGYPRHHGALLVGPAESRIFRVRIMAPSGVCVVAVGLVVRSGLSLLMGYIPSKGENY